MTLSKVGQDGKANYLFSEKCYAFSLFSFVKHASMTPKQHLATALKQFQAALASGRVTLTDITGLAERLAKFYEELRQTEARKKYEEALQAAKSMGYESLSELEQRILNPNAPVVKKRIVKPVYRNPDVPSETWAGRGKPPRWLKAKLDAGANIDDFRIAKSD
jgi:DNA-binding protein H-NS